RRTEFGGAAAGVYGGDNGRVRDLLSLAVNRFPILDHVFRGAPVDRGLVEFGGDRQLGGNTVLQKGGNGGAVDQRRQAGGEDGPAELPSVPVQRSAAVGAS